MSNNTSNSNPFSSLSHADNQCTLSYELLIVLQWLIDHETPRLKKMIAKGLTTGLKERLETIENDQQNMQEMQDSIVSFFGLLEVLLAESMHEQTMQSAMEKNLLPALDQIDASICDDATLRFSIEKAISKNSLNNNSEKPQDVLFRELLRHWKPHNKKELN